jgi:hypothetical protein
MNKPLLRTWFIAISVYCCSAPAFAAWLQQVVDAGGLPGANIAISSATSKAYIPLLREKALAVFDGVAPPYRMELAIKPTAVADSSSTEEFVVPARAGPDREQENGGRPARALELAPLPSATASSRAPARSGRTAALPSR